MGNCTLITSTLLCTLRLGQITTERISYPCVTRRSPSGRAIHVPQISKRIFGGIRGDHPCGNFLIISVRKFRGNEGEFSMLIFPPPFPAESLGIFPLNFHVDSCFTYNPNFQCGYPPPTTKIPGDSPQNLLDFARWA